jgi:hypothetical protein
MHVDFVVVVVAVEDRDIEMLAFAGAMAVEQGGRDGEGRGVRRSTRRRWRRA